MNAATKYVASRTLEIADARQNSILLRGDAVGPAPLTEFELTGSGTTSKGVIIAHYARR
ncbi:hypothetical protein AB0M41_45030 [Streptomyces sp. NPDC051896]